MLVGMIASVAGLNTRNSVLLIVCLYLHIVLINNKLTIYLFIFKLNLLKFLVTRHLNYPSYQFNVLRLIIFSRKFNVYFALSKEYALKVSYYVQNKINVT